MASSSSPSPIRSRRTIQRRHHPKRIRSSSSSDSPPRSPRIRSPLPQPLYRRIARRSTPSDSSISPSSDSLSPGSLPPEPSPRKLSPQIVLLRQLKRATVEERATIVNKLKGSEAISVKNENDIERVIELQAEGFRGRVVIRPRNLNEEIVLRNLCNMNGLPCECLITADYHDDIPLPQPQPQPQPHSDDDSDDDDDDMTDDDYDDNDSNDDNEDFP